MCHPREEAAYAKVLWWGGFRKDKAFVAEEGEKARGKVPSFAHDSWVSLKWASGTNPSLALFTSRL